MRRSHRKKGLSRRGGMTARGKRGARHFGRRLGGVGRAMGATLAVKAITR